MTRTSEDLAQARGSVESIALTVERVRAHALAGGRYEPGATIAEQRALAQLLADDSLDDRERSLVALAAAPVFIEAVSDREALVAARDWERSRIAEAGDLPPKRQESEALADSLRALPAGAVLHADVADPIEPESGPLVEHRVASFSVAEVLRHVAAYDFIRNFVVHEHNDAALARNEAYAVVSASTESGLVAAALHQVRSALDEDPSRTVTAADVDWALQSLERLRSGSGDSVPPLAQEGADRLPAVVVDLDGLGQALFELSHEPSFEDSPEGVAEARAKVTSLLTQYVEGVVSDISES